MAWDVKAPILRTPDTALRLAEILFVETIGADELQWFLPFKVENNGAEWFVTGHGDDIHKRPPDPFHDQFVDEAFQMQVVKADAEVKDFGITAGLNIPPEVKAQIRATLEAEGKWPPSFPAQTSSATLEAFSIMVMANGGIINSTGAAIRFGELLFENHFSLQPKQFRKLHAEEVEGLWHIYGRADGQSAELVFRRSNAQVISLDLRPVE
ncbi:MAG: hypothetical protein ACLPID_00925 [Beijerinckiaceae bacterium]